MAPAGDTRTDAALLAALARGDVGAFDVLYARAAPMLSRVALRVSGQESDAADAVQEAFLHLFDVAPRLRLRGRVATYLYPVTVRLARRARERAGRFASDQDALGAALETLAARRQAAPGTNARDAALEDALRGLPEGPREALLLRAVDGLSVTEVADALGVPEGTVKSRVHAARQALRDALGRSEG